MSRFDGSLARTLDFGETTTTTGPVYAGGRAGLRLALPGGILRGADKYKVLERRRRQAQIKARRVLDLFDAVDENVMEDVIEIERDGRS
jgi:hypothetical protein